MKFRIASIAISLATGATFAHGQLTTAEKNLLADTLFMANLEIGELSFGRAAAANRAIPFVSKVARNPIEEASGVMELHRAASNDPSRLLSALLGGVFAQPERITPGAAPASQVPDTVPEPYRAPVAALAKAISESSAQVRAALDGIPADKRRDLIESLPRFVCADPSVKFDFVRRPMLPDRELIGLIGKVDMGKILAASIYLSQAIDDQVPRLRAAASTAQFVGTIRFETAGVICVLGGVGPNEHTDRDAVLTIDLGGDDIYRGRHGAGVGYASVLLDLSGDDRYQVSDLNVGAAILGVGIAADFGGDDTFKGGSICFGAALGGVGILKKAGGADIYRTASLSLGFAASGIGLLSDGGGNDLYTSRTLSQGSSFGPGVGWLMDLQGDDVYSALGQSIDAPEFRSARASKSQGFATSVEGLDGGLGLLTDLAGEDSYIASTRAQACGANRSIGSLMDVSGSDSYRAHHYSQSAASADGLSMLFDLQGDDSYVAGSGGSQASSFSQATAIFLDRRGDDLYASRDGRPARAAGSSLSVFMDMDGADFYAGEPGTALAARRAGSLAIFMDAAGPDEYRGHDDGEAKIRPDTGVLNDAPGESIGRPTEQPSAQLPTPGSIKVGSSLELAGLFRSACSPDSNEASKAISTLVGMGLPATKWLLDNRLIGCSGREAEVLAIIVNGVGVAAKNDVGLRVSDKSDESALAALRVCAAGRIMEAGPVIVQALDRPLLARLAADCAGWLGNGAAVPKLMVLCASDDEELRFLAMRSLAELGDVAALGTAQAMMASSDFRIRSAAINLLAKFPIQSITVGRTLMRDLDERKARLGCELLSRIGTIEAIRIASDGLADTRPGVRIQALLAVDGRCPVEKIALVMSLKQDADPRVRAVAATVSPIR